MMKYKDWSLGEIEAVLNKLGGEEGARRFLAGELVVKPAPLELKIFKTIKLGTGLKTADDFRKAIMDKGMHFYSEDVLSRLISAVAAEETEVDLVVVSIAELGFKNGAYPKQIYARAKELGLQPCPAEVGPQLRLQYPEQPNKELLIIGTELNISEGHNLEVMIVEQESWSSLCLSVGFRRPDVIWESDWHFVFIKPRK
jgi:hypothetical protein